MDVLLTGSTSLSTPAVPTLCNRQEISRIPTGRLPPHCPEHWVPQLRGARDWHEPCQGHIPEARCYHGIPAIMCWESWSGWWGDSHRTAWGAFKVKVEASTPPVLTEENMPVELKVWKKKWHSYYTATGMDKAAVKVQHSFLDSFLNSHLCNLLAEETIEETLIFPLDGQASCIGVLDTIFVRFYPPFVQRAEFWAMCQKPGQHYSEGLALCRCLGDECDVVNMKADEIICPKMVTICTDEELRSELMKPDNPTVAKLTRIVQEHERAQAGKQGLDGEHALAAPPGPKAKLQQKGKTCKSCGGRSWKAWHKRREHKAWQKGVGIWREIIWRLRKA